SSARLEPAGWSGVDDPELPAIGNRSHRLQSGSRSDGARAAGEVQVFARHTVGEFLSGGVAACQTYTRREVCRYGEQPTLHGTPYIGCASSPQELIRSSQRYTDRTSRRKSWVFSGPGDSSQGGTRFHLG